jgi:hypothetical protein
LAIAISTQVQTAIQICALTAFSVVPKKRLDPQVLFDPLEEQLDLPALAAEVCDQLGFEGEVVGQRRDSLATRP